LKRGLPDNAVPLFRESIQANNNSASAHYHLGFALLALNQRDEASRELATALKLAPTAQDAVRAREQLARLNGTERSSATP
jgi:Flp pilus assembly protein TadD